MISDSDDISRLPFPETNIAPEHRPGPKRKVFFQPSILRGKLAVSFREVSQVKLGFLWMRGFCFFLAHSLVADPVEMFFFGLKGFLGCFC